MGATESDTPREVGLNPLNSLIPLIPLNPSVPSSLQDPLSLFLILYPLSFIPYSLSLIPYSLSLITYLLLKVLRLIKVIRGCGQYAYRFQVSVCLSVCLFVNL